MGLDRWESLHPGAEMTYDIVREVAHKIIAAGRIQDTSEWSEAFREFHKATQDAYKVFANQSLFEQFLRSAKPTVALLLQIVSDHPDKFIMSAQATNQAERDQLHEKLFHEIAPRLITDIAAGSNRYSVALENRRIEERRQQMWDLSLEELEALKAKKNLRNLSKEELRKIVNDAEPGRREQMISGNRHTDALPEQLAVLRERGAAEVKEGIFRKIPDEWKIPGKELTVPFSKNLLSQLPKEIVAKLLQMYGNNQLTYACELTKFKLSQKK